MGKVIIHATMSLDGFIAGPHDEMDWVFKYDDDGMANEVMQEPERSYWADKRLKSV